MNTRRRKKRTCPSCGKRNTAKDMGYCRLCHNKRMREWRAEQRQKVYRCCSCGSTAVEKVLTD